MTRITFRYTSSKCLSRSSNRCPWAAPLHPFPILTGSLRSSGTASEPNGVRLISKNGNVFKSFPGLCDGLARDLRKRRCVLDGEIVCLDAEGKSRFRDLLHQRAEPHFYTFDVLWDEHAWSDDEEERRRFRNGEDLRYLQLSDRKLRLRALVPQSSERLLFCDHIQHDGDGLFRLSCEHDLEGIVAKRKDAPT